MPLSPLNSRSAFSPPSGVGAINLGLSTPNVELISPEAECSICLDTMEQPVGGEWRVPSDILTCHLEVHFCKTHTD